MRESEETETQAMEYRGEKAEAIGPSSRPLGGRFPLPVNFLILTVLVIFAAEAFVMWALELLPTLPWNARFLVDAFALSVLVLPALFLWLYRPMRRYVFEGRQADETLRLSEERFRSTFEQAAVGIAHTATDGRFARINERFCSIVGYTREELLGRSFQQITHAEDLDVDLDKIRQVLAGVMQTYSLEKRYIRKDGSTVWVNLTVSLVREPSGKPEYFIAVAEDITNRKEIEEELTLHREHLDELVEKRTTELAAVNDRLRKEIQERKLAEEALRESEAKNRALLDAIPDMMFRIDKDGTYLEFRPGKALAPYVPPEEFLGRKLHEVLPKDVADACVQQMERVIRTRVTQVHEYSLHEKDGLHHYEARWLASRENEVLSIVRDITERKQAETEQMRLAIALRSVGEAIFITDTAGGIQYVNPAFERMTGHKREEVIGQNPRVLKSGEHEQGFYQEMWDTIGRGELWWANLSNKKKDGELFYVEETIAPVRDYAGEVINYVAVMRDITERRTAEEALHQSEEQLRQSQKMEAVGKLAGGVAHDFNNLLTAITGYSELVMSDLDSGDPRRQDLEEVKKAADRAAALTRQLLAFSRRQVLQPRVLDLNGIVTGVGKMLRRLIGEDIELVTLLDPALERVKADPGQIEQVILNLSVNAREAMPEGGKLTIETANSELEEAHDLGEFAVPPGRYVMLTVGDTGVGMDKETQSRIFEPFFTTREPGKGTGLGLSTVYGIVKQSGGYVWVYSEPGLGTTFKIYLPRVEEALLEVEPAAALAQPPAGTETILLVEDEPAVRALAARLLRSVGYTVVEARNGAQALEVCKQQDRAVDLLVTDVVMPQMGGPELAERLTPLHPEMKVLFMSGYTDDAVLRHGLLESGAAFLQKPFTRNALAAKVREVLDKT